MVSANTLTRSGFIPARVVHLHPSKFCNLTCRHCYSSSGPNEKPGLSVADIIPALEILWSEGYEVLSLSGGEPLLYRGFEEVARCAAEIGFQVNLITNGAPVGGQKLEAILNYVNLLAISLDGAPETHNEMRGSSLAFSHVERAIARLSANRVRFGFSFCVSQKSLIDIPWAAEFAQETGAQLLHLHPFAATGRGAALANELSLRDIDMARAYVVAKLLAPHTEPAIQIDIAPVEVARNRRGDYVALDLDDACDLALADLVSPLVIDETGMVIPFSYGINPQFAIGQLDHYLTRSIRAYKATGWRQLADLLDVAFATLAQDDFEFVDWFFHIVQVSRQSLVPSQS